MDNRILLLLLKVAHLWSRQMQYAYEEDPDDEIREEIHDLLISISEVESIYRAVEQNENQINSMPSRIADFVTGLEPDLMPVEVTVFSEQPLKYLLSVNGRISRLTAEALDLEFGADTIVLERAALR